MMSNISGPQVIGSTAKGPHAPQPIRWTPKLVERFWNGFAQTRLVNFSFSKQAGKSLIVAIDHLLPRNGSILDYGAGDGYLIRLLCERGLCAAAYEPSIERSENLRELLGDCKGFLGVERADTTKSFDVVIMAEVIEHILDELLDTVMKQLFSLVRPGGLLIITTPNNEDLELGMAYCPVSNTLFHRWQHVRSFTDKSLVVLLAQYGFEELATHRVEFNNSLYVPYDPIWGEAVEESNLPFHIKSLRSNQPTNIAGETNILFIGRRVAVER